MIVLLLVVFGLCLGSFVNALVWRMHERATLLEKTSSRSKENAPNLSPKEKQELQALSMWRGRSMCPHCRHVLAPKDLVPVASWIALRGRCRYCHAKIDDTPLAEIATPLIFVASYVWWPEQFHGAGLFEFVLWLVFVVGFMTLTLYDLRWLLLPNKIVYPLLALAVAEVVVLASYFNMGWSEVGGAIAGAVIVGGLFYLLYAVSDGKWIGGGDVKLGAVLGLLAGGPMHSVLLLFVASLAGVLYGLPQIITGKAARRSQIPFGPFLIYGLLIVQLFGSNVVDWYERLLVR